MPCASVAARTTEWPCGTAFSSIATAGGIAAVLQQARALNAGVEIQIEVEDLDEMHQALSAGATNPPTTCSMISAWRMWGR